MKRVFRPLTEESPPSPYPRIQASFWGPSAPEILAKIAEMPLVKTKMNGIVWRPVLGQCHQRSEIKNTHRHVEELVNKIDREGNLNLAELWTLKNQVIAKAFEEYIERTRKYSRELAQSIDYLYKSEWLLVDMLVQSLVMNHEKQETEAVSSAIDNHAQYYQIIQQHKQAKQQSTDKLIAAQKTIDSLIFELRLKRKQLYKANVKTAICNDKINEIKDRYVELQAEFIGLLAHSRNMTEEQANNLLKIRAEFMKDLMRRIKMKGCNRHIRKELTKEILQASDESILKMLNDEIILIVAEYQNSPHMRSIFIEGALEQLLPGDENKGCLGEPAQREPFKHVYSVGTDVNNLNATSNQASQLTLNDQILYRFKTNASVQTPCLELVSTEQHCEKWDLMNKIVQQRFKRERVLELKYNPKKDKITSGLTTGHQTSSAALYNPNKTDKKNQIEGIKENQEIQTPIINISKEIQKQYSRKHINQESLTSNSGNNKVLSMLKEGQSLPNKDKKPSYRLSVRKLTGVSNEFQNNSTLTEQITKVSISPASKFKTQDFSETFKEFEETPASKNMKKHSKTLQKPIINNIEKEKPAVKCHIDLRNVNLSGNDTQEATTDQILTEQISTMSTAPADNILNVEEFKVVADLYETRQEIQALVQDVERLIWSERSRKTRKIINLSNMYKLISGAYTRAYSKIAKGELVKNLVLSLFEEMEIVYGTNKSNEIYRKVVDLIVSISQNRKNYIFEAFLYFLGFDPRPTCKSVTSADTMLYLNLLDQLAVGTKVTAGIDVTYTTMNRVQQCLLPILYQFLMPPLAVDIYYKVTRHINHSYEARIIQRDGEQVKVNLFRISTVVVDEIISFKEQIMTSFQKAFILLAQGIEYPFSLVQFLAFTKPEPKYLQAVMLMRGNVLSRAQQQFGLLNEGSPTIISGLTASSNSKLLRSEISSICLKSQLLSLQDLESSLYSKYKVPRTFSFSQTELQAIFYFNRQERPHLCYIHSPFEQTCSHPKAQYAPRQSQNKSVKEPLANHVSVFAPERLKSLIGFNYLQWEVSKCLDSILGSRIQMIYALCVFKLANESI